MYIRDVPNTRLHYLAKYEYKIFRRIIADINWQTFGTPPANDTVQAYTQTFSMIYATKRVRKNVSNPSF